MDLPLQIPFLAERTDLVALLDEFASRFFDELDYVKECSNGVAIREQMQHIKQVSSLTTTFLMLLLHSMVEPASTHLALERNALSPP